MVLPSLPDAAFERLAPVLLDLAARSAVVLGLAGAAVLLMRRASAAARHWVWLLGFAGLLLLPVLATAVPGWRVLPPLATGRSAAPVTVIVAPPLAAAPEMSVPNPVRPVEPLPANAASARPAPSQEMAVAAQPAAMVQPSGVTAGHDAPAKAPNPHSAALSWSAWLVLAWLTGALLVLGYVLLGHLSLWLLQRRCTHISGGEWAELLGQLRQRLRARRDVELLSTPLRTMPMTWGLWRTRLLLPEQAAGWPAEQRRSVLLHELGHIVRHDCLTQLLTQMACALYWFNPIVWIAWNRMQVERERACDDLVLNAGVKASAYADDLLHSAALGSGWRSLRLVGAAALAMARPSTLEQRFQAILDGRRNRHALTSRTVLATICLLIAGLVPVAILRAQEITPRAPEPAAAAAAPATPVSPVATATAGAGAGPRAIGRAGGRGFGGGSSGPSGSFGTPMPSTPAALGEGPTCTLDATIYDVRLPADQIGRLDVEALTRASANPVMFERALSDLGTTQPLYRVNQSVRLISDSILISTQTPYISNSQTTNAGQVINQVNYTQTGAAFSIAGKAGGGAKIELDLKIQVSAISAGNTPITPNVNAPMFRTAAMSHKGPIDAQRPFVVVSVDAASADADGKAVAYIARVILGAPQTPTTAPGGGQ